MAGYDNYIDVIKDKDNNFYAIHAFTDSITSSQLKTNAVTTSKIASEAVTSAKLATGAVTVAKLASDVQELMSTKGVMTLNGISGSVSILPGATNGTVQIKNATNQTSTVAITGLDTAAYQPSSAFAPAYNYVKTINGQTASSNGNISVATGDIYTIKYSSTFNMSTVVEKLQTSQAIRLATRYTPTGDNSDEKNYAELVRYTLVDEYEEGASEPTSTHVGEMLFQRNGLILVNGYIGDYEDLSVDRDDRGQLQTFRWSYDEGWGSFHYSVPPLSSPEFTGTPIAPTASVATSNTQIATTAFVKNAISTITADQVGFGSPAIPNATNVNTALVSLASKVTNLTANQIGCQTVEGDRDVGEALDNLYSNFDNIYATDVHFSGSTFPSAITTVDQALKYLKDTSAGSATEPIVVTYGDDITYAQFQQIHNNNRLALLIDPNGLLPSGQYGTAYGYVAETYLTSSTNWSIRFQLNDFSNDVSLLDVIYHYSSSSGTWSVGRMGLVSQTQFGQLSSAVSNLAQDVDELTTDDIRYATDTTKTATSVLSSLQSTKANISSPTFTGTPQAPTASSDTNTTQIATTAFVKSITVPLQSKVSNLTTDDIADATDSQHTATDWLESLQSLAFSLSSNKANINSPTFTGIPQAPTASAGTNNTQIATTSFAYNAAKCVKVEYGSTVQQSDIQRAYFSDSKYILCYKDEAPDYEIYQLTHIDDEQGQGDFYDFCQIRNGVVTELRYNAGADSWSSSYYSIVTSSQLSTKANLSSPTFTGVPKAPTASAGTSTTQLATTAFVQQELSNVSVEKNICQAFTVSAQYVDAGESRMSFSLPTSVLARDWDTFVIGSDLSLYSGGIKILQNGRYKLTGVAHIEPAQSYPTGFGIYQLASGSSSFTNLTSTYGMHEYGTDLYVTATRQLISGTVVGLYGLADPSIPNDVEYNNLSLLVEQIDKNDHIEPIDPLNPSDGEIPNPGSGNETG